MFQHQKRFGDAESYCRFRIERKSRHLKVFVSLVHWNHFNVLPEMQVMVEGFLKFIAIIVLLFLFQCNVIHNKTMPLVLLCSYEIWGKKRLNHQNHIMVLSYAVESKRTSMYKVTLNYSVSLTLKEWKKTLVLNRAKFYQCYY